MKKRICFLVAFIACLFVCSPAFAFTMYETDEDGNTKVLMSVDSDLMNGPTMYAQSWEGEAPHPQVIGLKVEELEVLLADQPIPNGASVIFFDFGPNWETILTDSNMEVYGRYCYLFYGKYNTTFGHVRNGWGGGDSKTEYDESTHTLSVAGPYAWVSYNMEEKQLYSSTNCYTVSNPNYYTLTLEDVYVQGAPDAQYPMAVAFDDDKCTSIDFGSTDLTAKISDFTWDMDLDAGGDVNTDFETVTDFWDFIRNGWFTESDNIIIRVFTKCVQGMASIVDIIDWAPHFFSDLVSVLPEPFVGFVKIAFSIIVTAIVIKFVFHLIP